MWIHVYDTEEIWRLVSVWCYRLFATLGMVFIMSYYMHVWQEVAFLRAMSSGNIMGKNIETGRIKNQAT